MKTSNFDPRPTEYPFPKDTSKHYLVVKKNNGLVFDRNYPYVDRSRKMRFKQAMTRFLLCTVVFPVARVRMGLRIKGKKNLKIYKKELENGFITCSNHVHMWDYICVMRALFPKKPYLLAWARNVRGENSKLMRLVRAIPIPEDDPHALAAMNSALGGIFKEHGALQIYAEGSMWEYYRPVRPFKTGMAYLACRYSVPVLPMAFSYREPGFIRRRIFRQKALFTLCVGEPQFADTKLGREEMRTELTERCQKAVCRLAGFKEGENIYPPVYDNSERIDYYPIETAEK